MRKTPPSLVNLAREFIEAIAKIFIGEPARIVRKSTLDRLVRLAYRDRLHNAERRQDLDFLARELVKNQLTHADLRRISQHHTPIQEWPDEVDEDLLHESAYPVSEGRRSAAPEAAPRTSTQFA